MCSCVCVCGFFVVFFLFGVCVLFFRMHTILPVNVQISEQGQPTWAIFVISRIQDQNGVSQLYNMLEIYHSGLKSSICLNPFRKWRDARQSGGGGWRGKYRGGGGGEGREAKL